MLSHSRGSIVRFIDGAQERTKETPQWHRAEQSRSIRFERFPQAGHDPLGESVPALCLPAWLAVTDEKPHLDGGAQRLKAITPPVMLKK